MINLPSWMFLSSYVELREELLLKTYITSLIQFGRGIFGSDFGSVSFCLDKSKSNGKKGVFRRLFIEHVKVDSVETKEKRFLDECYGYHIADQSKFSKIPGSPIAYWVSNNIISAFEEHSNFEKLADPRLGMSTNDNGRFLKIWHEVNFEKIGFDFDTLESVEKSQIKWLPYNKGGEFRRWYGNMEFIINWENDGREVKDYASYLYKSYSRTVKNIPYFLKRALTWTLVTSGKFSSRLLVKGSIIGDAGPTCYPECHNEKYILGLLNCKPTMVFLNILNPTLNFSPGVIKKVPIIMQSVISNDLIIDSSVSISKSDWDFHENSWDFTNFPLINLDHSLEAAFYVWKEKMTVDFYQLHVNEEELNRIYIALYGLNNELDPIIPLKEITILQGELDRNALEETDKELRKNRQWKLEVGKWQLYIDGHLQPISGEGELPQATVQPSLPIKKNVVMQQLISYAVGCMMGRYSLDAPGLILANQGETMEDYKDKVKRLKAKDEDFTFMPDDDGIVPMMGSNCGFSDDAVLRLRQFIEAVWGSETLTQNINFLQSCLDMEIEKYLVTQNNFWKDHCSRYKKKPIYWLFSSKKGAFQVLVYMHRMNRFTVQRIRESYMFKHLQWLVNQKAELERRSATLSRDETRQLDTYRTALTECQEYDLQLKNIADQQIEFDLDDGVSVNYEKFEPLLAGIK